MQFAATCVLLMGMRMGTGWVNFPCQFYSTNVTRAYGFRKKLQKREVKHTHFGIRQTLLLCVAMNEQDAKGGIK